MKCAVVLEQMTSGRMISGTVKIGEVAMIESRDENGKLFITRGKIIEIADHEFEEGTFKDGSYVDCNGAYDRAKDCTCDACAEMEWEDSIEPA